MKLGIVSTTNKEIKMKIKKILSQHRRDFTALYVCGHCGVECKSSGYDDDNFHRNVIPKMECQECGKRGEDDYRPMGTKYPEWQQV